MNVAILTISDRSYSGEREDLSGKVIEEEVAQIGAEVKVKEIVPDEKEVISQKLIDYADNLKVDLILTTGGTGFSPRDFTPEATEAVLQRRVPGIAEAMRQESLKVTPHAMLSRATSGIRGKTLIINLPGSPKAVRECLQVIKPALIHGIEVLRGEATE